MKQEIVERFGFASVRRFCPLTVTIAYHTEEDKKKTNFGGFCESCVKLL
jgi:hypothetical protein